MSQSFANDAFGGLIAAVGEVKLARPVGRVAALAGGLVTVAGLGRIAALGDRVSLERAGRPICGEILALTPDHVTVLPESPPEGLAIGEAVLHLGPGTIAPDDSSA